MEEVSRVEQRREMLEAPRRFGISVTEACRLYDVSRQTFYYWERRLEAEGNTGLENHSTAPKRSPGRIPWALESRIVELRKAHPRWGARRLRAELRRRDVKAPARSTVERVIVRNDLRRAPAPKPPPPIRFERERGNELCRRETVRPTGTTGNVAYGDWIIGLGRAWTRTKVRVEDLGTVIRVWAADGTLIREVEPDRTRRYLGTGKPRGVPARM